MLVLLFVVLVVFVAIGGVVEWAMASLMTSLGIVVASPYTAIADNDHQKKRFHMGVARHALVTYVHPY